MNDTSCSAPPSVDAQAGGRKYAMMRLAKGDYLLPSNDARWLFRIATYDEDGSATWGDGTVLKGTFWAVYRRLMPRGDVSLRSLTEWDGDWEFWCGTLATRADAVREALRV